MGLLEDHLQRSRGKSLGHNDSFDETNYQTEGTGTKLQTCFMNFLERKFGLFQTKLHAKHKLCLLQQFSWPGSDISKRRRFFAGLLTSFSLANI